MDNKAWEYKVLSHVALDEKRLNSLGKEGWELVVMVLPDSQKEYAGYNLILKREK